MPTFGRVVPVVRSPSRGDVDCEIVALRVRDGVCEPVFIIRG